MSLNVTHIYIPRGLAHMHIVAHQMTGVINVGVRLPAVIFPVVIRPSGGLTLPLSLSLSLPCAARAMSLYFSFVYLYLFHPFFALTMCLSHTLYCTSAMPSSFFKWCSFPLVSVQFFAAFCPKPLHSNLCNGNPLMYAAILVLQYANWRHAGPHL